jgi:hypothetical protein
MIFAPIFTTFSRRLVGDHYATARGSAVVRAARGAREFQRRRHRTNDA